MRWHNKRDGAQKEGAHWETATARFTKRKEPPTIPGKEQWALAGSPYPCPGLLLPCLNRQTANAARGGYCADLTVGRWLGLYSLARAPVMTHNFVPLTLPSLTICTTICASTCDVCVTTGDQTPLFSSISCFQCNKHGQEELRSCEGVEATGVTHFYSAPLLLAPTTARPTSFLLL